jgi:hypothetical protein
MLVNVIVGGAKGDTTGGRKGIIMMSTEVVGIHMVEALDDTVVVETGGNGLDSQEND